MRNKTALIRALLGCGPTLFSYESYECDYEAWQIQVNRSQTIYVCRQDLHDQARIAPIMVTILPK